MMTLRRCSDSGRPRPPKRKPAAALLALVLASIPAWAQSGGDTARRDEALARASVEASAEVFALGYVSEAISLLDEALSLRPGMPDANFLRASYGLAAGEPPGYALGRLEKAIAGGAFVYRSKDEARLLYASLLSRTKRPADALRMIEGLAPNADTLYIASVSIRRLGDASGSRAAVLQSLKLFPGDPRPLLAWLRSEDRPIPSPDDVAVIKAGFARLRLLTEADLSTLTALAPYAGSIDDSKALVREFRSIGRASAESTLLALRYGLIGEEKAVEEILSGAYPITQLDLRALYASLSSDESRAGLDRRFAAFSGRALTDGDRDGIAEASTEYAAGLPVTWAADDDQDGLPETVAAFESGAPSRLRIERGSSVVEAHYGPWPFASSIEFSDGAGSRRYALAPKVLALPALALQSLSGRGARGPILVTDALRDLPSEKAVSLIAHAVARSSKGVAETARTVDGIAISSAWKDSSGRSGSAVYSRGLPSPESLDLDGDGRAETRRAWRMSPDGRPEAAFVEADLDADGLYEYRESLGKPFVRSWDYDADGGMDLVLALREDGTKVYRLAGFKGLSDASTIVLRSGKIIDVEEAGRKLALIPDSGGAVVWIGTKPFDFGAASPQPGYGHSNGIAYRVAEVEGSLYARAFK